MKKTRLTVLFVALGISLGIFAIPVIAQQPAQPAAPVARPAAQPAGPPNLVAIVDVAQLIRTHPGFIAKQGDLKKRMVEEEGKFRSRQVGISDQEKALLQGNSPLKPGTREYQDKVDQIAKAYSDFETEARLMQRRFALENSQILYDTFTDIKKSIAKFATASRIAQVTDYRYFEVSPNDPQTVMEDLEQKVVWFDKSLDITKHVIQQIYIDNGFKGDDIPTAAKIDEMLKEQTQPNNGQPAAATAGAQAPVNR